MFTAIKRRLRKSAVVVEFHKLYGVNLRAFGDEIGPGQLDDLLNAQFEFEPRNPMLGAQNVKQVLDESFGINVTGPIIKGEIARATGKWPEDNSN